MKKIVFFIFVLTFVFTVSYAASLYFSKQPEKQVSDVKKEASGIAKPVEQKDSTDFSVLPSRYDLTKEGAIYTLMHYMINTKVESDAIWGTLDLTKNRVRILKNAVTVSNWNDKEKLLDILNRWEKGDFSQAAEDHNYVWSKLGGTAGLATGVKNKNRGRRNLYEQ